MRFFVTYIVIVLVLSTSTSCKPEDGFCLEKEYKGEENFVCSEMEKYFSTTGIDINSYFTDKVLVYKNTYTDVGRFFDKPDHIPKAIPVEYMTKCAIGPADNGMVCNEWASFTFTSIEHISIKFSTRNDRDYSKNMTFDYAVLYLSGSLLNGFVSDDEVTFKDTALIEEEMTTVFHQYLILPK